MGDKKVLMSPTPETTIMSVTIHGDLTELSIAAGIHEALRNCSDHRIDICAIAGMLIEQERAHHGYYLRVND